MSTHKTDAGATRRTKGGDLGFEVVEVPSPEGNLDDLLDFIADLLVRKWMEGKTKGGTNDSQAGTSD